MTTLNGFWTEDYYYLIIFQFIEICRWLITWSNIVYCKEIAPTKPGCSYSSNLQHMGYAITHYKAATSNCASTLQGGLLASHLAPTQNTTLRLKASNMYLNNSNCWLLHRVSKKVAHHTLLNIFTQGWPITRISTATESEIIREHKCVINVLIFNVPKCCHLAN